MYERFSDAARVAVAQSEVTAFERGLTHVEPEDVMVALAMHAGIAGNVLRAVAADPEVLSRAVDARHGRDDLAGRRARPLPLSPRATQAFALAAREADNMGVDYIGTEHLLIGLLREPSGRASTALMDIRRDPGQIRERILDLVSTPGFVSPEVRGMSEGVAASVIATVAPSVPVIVLVSDSSPQSSIVVESPPNGEPFAVPPHTPPSVASALDDQPISRLVDEVAALRHEIALLRAELLVVERRGDRTVA